MLDPNQRRPLPFVQRSEWAGLGLWGAIVTAGILALQGLEWLTGWRLNTTAEFSYGWGIALAVALGATQSVVSWLQRQPADYGLIVDNRWIRHFLVCLLIGGATYCAYWLAPTGAGAVFIRNDTPISTWIDAIVSALPALLVVVMQEVVFRGFLLHILRRRLGSVAGILAASVLFGITFAANSRLDARQGLLVVAMALVGLLLSLMTIFYGSIAPAIGLMSGWLTSAIIVRRTGVITAVAGHPLAGWMCPDLDPRVAPVPWVLLILATAVFGMLLWMGRAPSPVGTPTSLPRSFKRFFPFSNPAMLAPLDLWLGQLWKARLAIPPPYWPRLVAILGVSALNTLLSLPERLLWPLLLRHSRLSAPVFILGLHRSGTTHLHNLLAQDRQFVTPRMYQVINPIGFPMSGWVFVAVLAPFWPRRRPMDEMKFSLFSPAEEEFAIAHTTPMSPYWSASLPRLGVYYDRWVFGRDFSPEEAAVWKEQLRLFLRKVCLWRSGRLLLKNPVNTARVSLLLEMFPDARFVHIYRHPLEVYRSNVCLAEEGHCVWQLQDPPPSGGYVQRFLDRYVKVEETFYSKAAGLQPNRVAEVRFEDLEKDPVGSIRHLYAQLELEFTDDYRERLRRYLDGLAGYRKNVLNPMSKSQQEMVLRKTAPLLKRWGYAENVAP